MRLVVLMVEVEQPEGISSRKLLLETARHNVITAYRGDVGVSLLHRFPNVDVAVIHTGLNQTGFEDTVRAFKKIRPDLPVIAISPISHGDPCGADYLISSHDPSALLHLLDSRFGPETSDPEAE